ncbi:hypothetical protein L249_4972, partial [Ophiocordyceps polyrhachis-furcata BCC 54312]
GTGWVGIKGVNSSYRVRRGSSWTARINWSRQSWSSSWGSDEFGIEAFNGLLGELATNEETGICSEVVGSGVGVLLKPEIRARTCRYPSLPSDGISLSI